MIVSQKPLAAGVLGVEFYDVYVLLKDERHRVPAVYRIDDQHVASSYGIRVVSLILPFCE